MSQQFWLENPRILLKKENLHDLWPSQNMSMERKLNTMTRFLFIISMVGFILINRVSILFLGGIFIAIIVFYYYNREYFNFKHDEGFSLFNKKETTHCMPTLQNPLMNPLTSDFNTNNKTKPALPNEAYGDMVNETAKETINVLNSDNKDSSKLFNDLEKNHDFEKSMRQFAINPSILVPNNQEDFLSFCYKDLPSNKNINVH